MEKWFNASKLAENFSKNDTPNFTADILGRKTKAYWNKTKEYLLMKSWRSWFLGHGQLTRGKMPQCFFCFFFLKFGLTRDCWIAPVSSGALVCLTLNTKSNNLLRLLSSCEDGHETIFSFLFMISVKKRYKRCMDFNARVLIGCLLWSWSLIR